MATMKVRLDKRQRQHSIPPMNLEELKEDKAVQFAAEVTDRFTALPAALNDLMSEDIWKSTKTVLLDVARETIGSVKSQERKKWISDEMRLMQQSGKREKLKAEIRTDIKN